MRHPSASAPSPRCGTSDTPQHQTDPQQSAPQSDPRDPNNHAPHPLQKCKAPQQPQQEQAPNNYPARTPDSWTADDRSGSARSEEHTSELQSHSDLVCRLLLEKKNQTTPSPSALHQALHCALPTPPPH